jgi:protein-tyrosine phosphatase
MAESVFRHKVALAGLTEQFEIQSAGTGDWHVGENPDPRTIRVLAGNGIHEFSRARQIKSSDFELFDHIVVMDLANQRDLGEWRGYDRSKVSLMSSWDPDATKMEVPDPYYGDIQDFEGVYVMLDVACQAMLAKLQQSRKTPNE